MQDTKERILAAAEKLFMENGINGASLRAITAEAKANIAAINYHFGSKDNLVQEVFLKYLYPLDHMRKEILREAAEKAGDQPVKVKDLVRAFLIPWFEFKNQHAEIMNSYLRFYGLQTSVTNTYFRSMVTETAKSAYAAFTDGVYKALPDIDEIVLRRRINMAVSTAASFIINDWLVKSLEDISEVEIAQEYLIDYLVKMIEKGMMDR